MRSFTFASHVRAAKTRMFNANGAAAGSAWVRGVSASVASTTTNEARSVTPSPDSRVARRELPIHSLDAIRVFDFQIVPMLPAS